MPRMSSLDEIGIDGPISDADREHLRDLDVDAVHAIPLDGPWSLDLLVSVADVGAARVRDAIFSRQLDGPASDEMIYDIVESLKA